MALNALALSTVEGADPVGGDPGPGELSLEEMILLVTSTKVQSLEQQTAQELSDLKKRQDQVKLLHQLLSLINKSTDSKGAFDGSKIDNISQILQQAKDLGVDLDPTKLKYSKEERERLVENIRLGCDDLNTQNEIQLQTINRLTNERYEVYQLARSATKSLHEDKISKARAMAGR